MTRCNEPFADEREMHLLHKMFRREIGLLPALVRRVASNDTERSAVIAHHAGLVPSMLHHHHSGEDAHAWPKLLERVPEDVASGHFQ